MAKRKTTKTRKKNAKLTKGQELNNLEYKKTTKSKASKSKKTNTQSKQKPTPKVIKKPTPIQETSIVIEKKPTIQPKKKTNKKEIRFKAEKKPFFNKTTISILVILGIIFGCVIYKFSYDNYIHKGNYVFKTNLTNVRANMTSTTKDIEPINEKVDESVIMLFIMYI